MAETIPSQSVSQNPVFRKDHAGLDLMKGLLQVWAIE